MSTPLTINPKVLDNPDDFRLLPVEVLDAGGKPQKIEYLFTVSSIPEELHSTKSSWVGLKVKYSTERNGNMIYVDEMFSYDPNYVAPFANFVKMLGLQSVGLTAEDFVGRWFWATVKRDSYKSTREFEDDGVTPKAVWQNKIDQYIRIATPEEVNPTSAQSEDGMPF